MTEKPDKNVLERFRQYLADIDFQFSEYTWNNFVNGKDNILCGEYVVWQREDAKKREKQVRKEKLKRAYTEGGSANVMSVLNKELEFERAKLQRCKSLMERDKISNKIASILRHRNAIKQSQMAVNYKAKGTQYLQSLYENGQPSYLTSHPKIGAGLMIAVYAIMALTLAIPSVLFTYCILTDNSRWLCVFLLLLYSALLFMASNHDDGITGKILFTLAIINGCAFLLVPVFYFWYYFCCGFLLFPNEIFGDSPSLGESIAYFILSMVIMSWLGGLIAMAFGWNPFK